MFLRSFFLVRVALVVLFLTIMLQWPRKMSGIAMASAVVSGIVAAIFSLGVMPYLESFVSRLSNLRLLELAGVNHPLLQKMSIEAPVEMAERFAQARRRMDGLDIVILAAGPPRKVRELPDEIVDPFVHFSQCLGKRIRIVVVMISG